MHHQSIKPRLEANSMNYNCVTGLILISYFIFLCFGHLLLPEYNEKIRFLMIMYLLLRTLSYLFGGLISYWETNKICERVKNMNVREFNEDFRNIAYNRQIINVFVMLGCDKDMQMLRQTLDRLKLHQGTKANYMVLLPLSINEQKQDTELTQLMQNYTDQFFILDLIPKPISQEHHPFWFIKFLQQKCSTTYNISVDKLLITMLNADSWVPEVYIRQIEDHLSKSSNASQKQEFIYQPIQIYTRNHLQIPFTTRIQNQLKVCLQANDCLSNYRPALPKYNYSLQYTLAKKISSFVSEGHHTEKIHPQIKVKLIYAPFNRLNVSIEGGYLSNTKATFDSIVNDAGKQLNLLYNILSSFGIASSCSDLVSIFYILIHIADKFLVVLVLQTIHSQTFTLLLSKAFAPLNIENVSILLCITLMILTSVHFLCYEFAKRKASFILFGLTNKTIFDIFQFNLLVGYIVVFFIVPAYAVSTFKSILSWESEPTADQDSQIDKPK